MMARDETPEERRLRWRQEYARQYPAGFKRRRNAEQHEKQAAAKRYHKRQAHVKQMRVVRQHVLQYLQGKRDSFASVVGCTREHLNDHLSACLSGQETLQWKLAYRRHPRTFDLSRREDYLACFHWSNMYAESIKISVPAFPRPSPLAP